DVCGWDGSRGGDSGGSDLAIELGLERGGRGTGEDGATCERVALERDATARVAFEVLERGVGRAIGRVHSAALAVELVRVDEICGAEVHDDGNQCAEEREKSQRDDQRRATLSSRSPRP